MSLKQFTKEQLHEMSLIEMAYEMLKGNNKQPLAFKEIVDEIKKSTGLTDEEIKTIIAQFYTDLNIDGRFIALGENRWGLRVWYPIDQIEDETISHAKTKKKKKTKKVVDDEDDLDVEDIEDEEEDFDDLDDLDDLDDVDEDEEDLDDLDDTDDDFDEEDDEDLLEEDEEEFDELDEDEEDLDEDEDDF